MSPQSRDDGGMAMISAVIVSGLLVTVVAAMLLSINARGDRIGRQHDYYAARAMGASAAGFLYAHLQDDPGFFTDMMAASSVTPPRPTTYDWIAWIDASATSEPDTATDSDWRRFSDAGAGELAQVQCDSSSPPCWVLRFKADSATAGSTPTTVVAEAIVRYDCRFGTYCSVLRFQQHLELVSSQWTRRDLTQVPETNKLT